MKIDYIEFPATDFDAVQNFYTSVFGWTFTDYGPEYRAFSDGTIEGGFRRLDKRAASEDGAPLVIFYAESLEAARENVVSSGGTIVVDIFGFPGGRRFHFADPHGNELAIWSDRSAGGE